MSADLVTDAGWETTRPAGRGLIVAYRATPRALLSYVHALGHATFAATRVHQWAEDAFFELHRQACTTALPDADQMVKRLLAKARPGGSALVLATGPSAKLIDPDSVTQDVRIACNSVVRDRDLLRRLKPDVIAFADPVFHFGPSRYGAAFRDDLLHAVDSTDAVLLTTQLYAETLLAHYPQLTDRLVVLRATPSSQDTTWRWPSPEDPAVRATSNVLTLLMLPAAFALADSIAIAGCDGRSSSERYFWTHNRSTQYSDELMQTVFDAHPAFFRDRDYADYYEQHCQDLEEFLSTAETAGKSVAGLTPSHIPALAKRGAPSFDL